MSRQTPSNGSTKPTGRRRSGRLWKACAGLLALLAVVAVAGKLWIMPSVLRSQVRRALSECWDGPVQIGDVSFGYLAPPVLHDLRLLDGEGHVWLRAGSVRLGLRDWPALRPVISEVHADDLAVQLFPRESGRPLPLRLERLFRPSLPQDRVRLEAVTLSDASLTRITPRGRTQWKGLRLFLRRRSGDYSLWLDRQSGDPGRQWWLRGSLRPAADGALRLSNCEVFTTRDIFTTDLEVLAGMDGNGGLAVRSAGAEAFGGRLHASMRYVPPGRDRPARYDGRLLMQGVNLEELTRVLDDLGWRATGAMTLRYEFGGARGARAAPSGRGLLIIDDGEFESLGILDAILLYLGVDPGDLSGGADVRAVFTVRGTVARIERAQFATRQVAADVEPGGTVNLETRQVDVYLVAAPLEKLRGLFELARLPRLPIPVISTVAALTESVVADLVKRLSRLHVVGPWDEVAKVEITAAPMRDLQNGTVRFMRDSLRTGGQLGQEAVRLFQGIFDALERNGAPSRPAGGPPGRE